jgi:hypothetical protein
MNIATIAARRLQASSNILQVPFCSRICVYSGAYAAVECAVLPGDSIKAEAGAMVTMSNNIDLEAKIEGSAGDACLRCCCAGESLFMSHFSLKPGMARFCSLFPHVTTFFDIVEQYCWRSQTQTVQAKSRMGVNYSSTLY